MIEAVEFPSEGALLRGRFYRPERLPPFPAVIMTHGTTATITMALDHYAEVFCHSGLAVLLYDHRNFGMSGGELRQQINPWIQARGYRDAMNYLLTRDDVRANRIAVWGDSYSGMIALVIGALEPRVAAVAVQCPTCGVEKPKIEPSDEHFQTMQGVFADGDVPRNTRNDSRPDARRVIRSGGHAFFTEADPGVPVVHRLWWPARITLGKLRHPRRSADAGAI
jgi:dienelactone hydrolase